MKEGPQAIAAPPRELFSVECTTCKARLKVRSLDAIGQILGCPKCHSMVLVAPPVDWQPEGAASAVASELVAPPIVTNVGTAAWKVWAAAAPAAILSCAGVFWLWTQLPERQASPIAATVTADPDVNAEVATDENSVGDDPLTDESTSDVSVTPDAGDEAQETPKHVAPPIEKPTADDESPPPAEPAIPVEAPNADPPQLPVAEPAVAADEIPPTETAESASTADDLLRRLQTSVAAIDEPAISLAALTDLLGGLSACPIQLDEASLKTVDVTGETETSVKLEEGTIEAALTAALAPLRLSFEPRGKAIVIFASAK